MGCMFFCKSSTGCENDLSELNKWLLVLLVDGPYMAIFYSDALLIWSFSSNHLACGFYLQDATRVTMVLFIVCDSHLEENLMHQDPKMEPSEYGNWALQFMMRMILFLGTDQLGKWRFLLTMLPKRSRAFILAEKGKLRRRKMQQMPDLGVILFQVSTCLCSVSALHVDVTSFAFGLPWK